MSTMIQKLQKHEGPQCGPLPPDDLGEGIAVEPLGYDHRRCRREDVRHDEVLVTLVRRGELDVPGIAGQRDVGAALVGKLGRAATTRNWATVLKIRALMPVS